MLPRQQHLFNALNACVAACNQCFTSSLAGAIDTSRVRSIQLSRDCADLCQLVAAFVARGSEHVQYLLRECAELCRACADEVTQYPQSHCRHCTEACRQAEDACRTAY
ncbi:four-helix bundle copper-binding protein [Hymenobacter sp. BT683]|uniref:Four-helix bundle copper-binding protein n=1 Tax=Hymenobacter jeongseonensis TaxID=2791027 RepID=A0ABS0IM35_9BACT|nr:four-helix bundle copper-binding protein [Hymenobacter jeongseonensis]MBF9239431.1 four-helix bundle copper-binding protein [Hymenobacter jeongseonensis]